MKKTALLVIDMINDFLKNPGHPLYCGAAEPMIDKIGRLVDMCHEHEVLVVFAQDAHRERDADFSIRPVHAVKGTWGAQLIPELQSRVTPTDYFVLKRRHSAFSYTDLDLYLQEEHVERVALVGTWTNIAIRSTASDAFYRPYQVTVIEDCCISQSADMHMHGLRDISFFGSITSFHQFILREFDSCR